MRNILSPSHYSMAASRVTGFILHGSLITTSLTSTLLIIHDSATFSIRPRERTVITIAGLVILLCAELVFYKKYIKTVNILLIIFYEALAGTTLLFWGLSSPFGLLVASFAIILPGILMNARAIPPVAVTTIALLCLVFAIHSNGFISPASSSLTSNPNYWTVLIYSTIFIATALVSWLSVRLREENLERARQAEAVLRYKQDSLRSELEKESTALRLEQLKQIHQLHKFALLGQSTAATLHELSNHLSVLNLDIDDIRQQHNNSRAISNAMEGIDHINRMVRQARRRLTSYEVEQTFNAIPVIQRTIKDLQEKFKQHHVKLIRARLPGLRSFYVSGSTLALMQIITILLNNALDACCEKNEPNQSVHISLTPRGKALIISIKDTGVGISPGQQKSLFQPIASQKATGLGVGLYIAKQLTETQFGGTITLQPSQAGAHFTITLPALSRERLEKRS